MRLSLSARHAFAATAFAALFGNSPDFHTWIRPAAGQGLVGIEEIVVSVRKREERLQEVPEAISVLTSKDFEAANTTDLKDVALLTPSFTLSNRSGLSAQRTARNDQTLFIRGVSRGGVGLFVNGAPANAASATIGDLDRIEILKGPQNAYFGRSTFAGAVNYVTKTPSEDWRGTLEGIVGTYALHDFRGSIEGALIPETLSVRFSARHFAQNGQYHNSFDGVRMTDQSTLSASAIFDLHKGDNLKVTFVTLFNRLHDGLPMFAKFKDIDFNCNAGLAPAGQNNYICGQLPRFPENRLGASYYITGAFHDVLFNNSLNFPNPSGVKPNIDGFETKNYDVSWNLRADYTFESNGILDGTTISYLGTINGAKSNSMRNPNAENTAGVPNPNFGRVAFATPTPATVLILYGGLNLDIYHEVRIAGNPTNRFRWMVGSSYSRPLNHIFGMNYGVTTTGAASFGTNFANYTTTYTKPIGLFGSLNFDITDRLTANTEARYQYDKIRVRRTAPTPEVDLAQAVSWKLMPRISLQYKLTPDVNTYVSWARGFQPASFNAGLFTLPDSTVTIVQNATGAGKTVQGEQMDMYELGVKGRFLDGKLAVNTDIYYGNWTNQVIPQRVNTPNVTNPNVTTVTTVNTNLGKTELKGWELDAAMLLTDKLRTRITFAYNGMTIKSYNCSGCEQNLTGNPNVNGNRLAETPTTTGGVFLEYRDTFRGNSTWYANTQFTYVGKIYAEEANLAWTMPRTTFDFRAGLDFARTNVELYVINAFNDYYYDVVQRNVEFAGSPRGAAFNNVVYVAPPEKRRFGLRVKYRWGGS